MKTKHTLLFLLLWIFTFSHVYAMDELEVQKVSNNIYAIVGSLENRTAKNLGNNATFGFVVTSAGVVLIDSGGTYKGAKQLHAVINKITDKKVAVVINTGGQDHRWLGNEYFKSLGAKIIANKRAVVDQKARLRDQLFRLDMLVGEDALKGTNPIYADETFDEKTVFSLGDTVFEIHYAGHAHTPGDSFVWLPKQKVIFVGDIVFTERMLGVGDQSSSKGWVEAYEKMASFKPEHLIPGHGHATTLEKANKDTYNYLKGLRKAVVDFMENDGDITEISKIDMSKFFYLLNHKMISGRNIQKVFTELEWE